MLSIYFDILDFLDFRIIERRLIIVVFQVFYYMIYEEFLFLSYDV